MSFRVKTLVGSFLALQGNRGKENKRSRLYLKEPIKKVRGKENEIEACNKKQKQS